MVSSYGRVIGPRCQLKPRRNRGGYLQVALSTQSILVTFTVHRLVMLSFVGPRPEGFHVNHKDGNKENNKLSNLEYTTPSDNVRHAISIGLTERAGESNCKAKLTREDVAFIRKSARGCSDLALDLNVTKSTISKVRLGHTWN